MSEEMERELRAEIIALRTLVVRNLRDELLSSRDPETQPDQIRLDFLQLLSRLYGNEQDRENLAVIKGKALEIINEAIDALNRLRSSKPPN
jgi:hypothetical protein